MTSQTRFDRKELKTPRSAAIAGIIFALLLISSMILIRFSLTAHPDRSAEWFKDSALSFRILIGLNMLPFAGIAFLWFIGVIRDLIGEREDKFFATVFLGSGLIFVAMLFAAAAVAGGLLSSLSIQSGSEPGPEMLAFGRAVTYSILYVFAMKMAGVFMISTTTMGLRAEVIPRWLGWLGYAFSAVLLVSITYWEWMVLLFPIWVLIFSTNILVRNYRRPLPEEAEQKL
jgi:hypothetical protein